MNTTDYPTISNPTIIAAKVDYPAVDAASFAAYYGSTFGDGPLFYNVGSVVCEGHQWSSTEWANFVRAIKEKSESCKVNLYLSMQLDKNSDRVKEWKKDIRDLKTLGKWASNQAVKVFIWELS